MNIRSVALLAVASLAVICFTCGNSERAEAKKSCHAHCEAQEDEGCGIGLSSCKSMCNTLVSNMDAECVPLAKASYDCNVEHNEVCGMADVCADKAAAYAECLFGD